MQKQKSNPPAVLLTFTTKLQTRLISWEFRLYAEDGIYLYYLYLMVRPFHSTSTVILSRRSHGEGDCASTTSVYGCAFPKPLTARDRGDE